MFNSRNLLAATAAATVALAASAIAGPAEHYHIFPATSFQSLATLPQPPASDMNYYGGPVFSNVKVETVMWNSDVLENTQEQIPVFTAALVNSTYVDQLGEYSTKGKQTVNGHKGTHQTINRGTYLGQVVLTPQNTSKVLRDREIRKELEYQISIGVLPPQDDNTLYMIYFPSDITIIVDGLSSCVVFGAYHSASIHNSRAKKHNVFYSVEPECNSGFDYLTFAASHEFAEATSDNIPTPGVNPNWPQAWNDSTGMEIGDKCSTNGTLTADTGSWQVTQVYLNSLHGCSTTTTTYTSP